MFNGYLFFKETGIGYYINKVGIWPKTVTILLRIRATKIPLRFGIEHAGSTQILT